MKAAIYLRVSTEEQRERQSIVTQRDFAERYCALHGIHVAGVFADDGVSGTIPFEQRPGGARLLEQARARQFEAVLVYKVDRIARDSPLYYGVETTLRRLGIAVVDMTDDSDDDSAAGQLKRGVKVVFSAYEKAIIRERSMGGSRRRAREGGWLGGMVPYGYCVQREAKGRKAHLALAGQPIPGLSLSEADVVRMIYRLSGDDGLSCVAIAERLRVLGVPPAHYRLGADRVPPRGRRPEGQWRAGGICNLIRSTTYRGLHCYGKRVRKPREGDPERKPEITERPVPAIVDEALWNRAQATLRRNLLMSPRNAKRKYLLRGLIKCGECGLTYVGSTSRTRKGDWTSTYSCNGHHGARATRCRSKRLPGTIEDVVWQDVEGFLREPGPVLAELALRLKETAGRSKRGARDAAPLRKALAGKDGERDRILGLYRRGNIDARALDRQMAEIEQERAQIVAELSRLESAAKGAAAATAEVRAAGDLLRMLHRKLDAPLSWDLRRQLVERLVEGIQARTLERDGAREVEVTVRYRFGMSEDFGCNTRGNARHTSRQAGESPSSSGTGTSAGRSVPSC